VVGEICKDELLFTTLVVGEVNGLKEEFIPVNNAEEVVLLTNVVDNIE
jgi:hypothetical protein